MKRKVWIGFVLFCLVSGTSWVVPEGDGGGTLVRQGVLFGVMGLGALCVSGWRRVSSGWRVGGAGVGLFGVPLVVVEAVRGSVGEFNRAVLFAMVPVVVVMVVAAGEEGNGARRRLAPALAGLGGLLLLLPLSYPGSARGWTMLGMVVGTVILVGFSSVWLYRAGRGVGLAGAMAVVGLANAMFLLVCGGVRGELARGWSGLALAGVPTVAGLLVDGVEVGLIVWLVREMPPERFAARYLLIPLVTILESYVVMRPEGTARMVGGMLLLAAGGALLAGLREEDQAGDLSLG